ncbi:MAG: 3'-5' exonuclease [Meiothermus sp.]|uniref:3'-5' exonuclease n=1 Tax=Meiothermus sp. TaxID=1955249 RepID=UPI0025EC0A4E|nr:3'-5' exonuclease [Meiothermus sp.]MCS7059147.1 3'-5' exonuclease [Meiothermus sp.]MCS7195481.1 3'-5' exonuclease [Meiothermus sp.]MCX7741208.1 3'-5' exonuclease [Meiothermus sp.]MDW8090409.1 3'-5' exonuclease [Meiothermus sp.]MDW8481089.1 3'-5' exonuclease [Meiothermus sp.]
MSPTHYRLSTRLARHLRGIGFPQTEPALAEVLVAPGLPRGGWAQGLLNDLLDGRFERREGRVGLWEWSYGFPPQGEPVVVLDVETTGLSPEQSEIVELALIRLENGRRTVFHRLVDPGVPIPPFISRLTGIRNTDVRGAPDVYAVLQEAWPMLQGATLIIQNAPFDLGFLRPRLGRLGYRLDNPVVDTMDWARKALPALSKRGLDALAWAFDLEVPSRHRALGDAEATLQVAYEMYYMLTAGKPRAVGQLAQRSL